MESQPLIESSKGSTKPSSQQSISYKSILIWFFRKTLWQRKNVYILVTLLIPILYLVCYYLVGLDEPNYKYAKEVIESRVKEEPQGYLVYSDYCKIIDRDPYKYEIMMLFNDTELQPCKPYPPLTQVHYESSIQRYLLSVDPIAFPKYNVQHSFGCCYKGVERISDDYIELTECQPFTSRTELSNTTDSVIVSCQTDYERIYINGHPTIPERYDVRQRLEHWAQKDRGKRVPSVLMIGIDSTSRLNLIRAMPETTQYLYDNDWFELAGYNKIEDNTFPNLMALLVGYNLSTVMKHCNPYEINGLDQCDFIWKLFQKHGYVTAYGEDAVQINTFNYMKRGFQQPPVDHYLRPYLFVAEKQLGGFIHDFLPECVGFELEAITVYKYAQEFANRYLNNSFFGFFWTSTHSHDTISQTRSMDEYLKEYMQGLVAQGILENSIVIFFSDHGLRFGPTRDSWSGYFEERLPFLFIWLPEFMRQAYPEFVDALRVNRKRLTTPYDLHLTLKHILSLTGRVGSQEDLGGAKDCPQCQSLFKPIPLNRSCADVSIEDHWCTCRTFKRTTDKILTRLAQHTVEHINSLLANGSYLNRCEPLQLNQIEHAYRADANAFDPRHVRIYMLTLTTLPNYAKYEATLRYDKLQPKHNKIRLTGSVSRLNSYRGYIGCLGRDPMIRYCYCRNQPRKSYSETNYL
ncbi:PREDICTED: uncharacterized protein LOC108614381 [Drosophila arizonae]|uniref:Uncharacterized protein LOC108614381 n=1 Tax=Drosophila arizonae TaxID=7263 RepID=A0ABM1P9T4_DROAR|nr:PREDICTED: uncharacterized protein LOC108614381 [Drosophila arizonae]